MILFQSRSRDTDVENKCMDTKGLESGGWGVTEEFRRSGLTHTHTHTLAQTGQEKEDGRGNIYWSPECTEVTQLCPALCDPMDCSLPGSSVHGILQAKTLEWVATPFFRGSSQPGDWTQVTCIASRFFHHLSHQRSPVLVTALSTELMLLHLNIKLRSISDALGIPATLHIISCLWMLSNICIGWPSSVNHF